MADEPPTNTTVDGLLDRLRAGDPSANEALVTYAVERFRYLASRMLHGQFERLQRWEMTDDVVQGASLRLFRALQSVRPGTAKDFKNLVATQIRRELLDLIDHHFGPEADAAHHRTDPKGREEEGSPQALLHKKDDEAGPSTQAYRKELHGFVEKLPEEEREVFQQLFYLDAKQEEVARDLGISVSTVKRRYNQALYLLHQAINGKEADP